MFKKNLFRWQLLMTIRTQFCARNTVRFGTHSAASNTSATITATTPPLQVLATATTAHGVIIIIRIVTINEKHNKA